MGDFVSGIWARISEMFDPTVAGTWLANTLANLIVGLVVFGIYLLVWILVRWLVRPALKRANLDETATTFIMTLLKFGLLAIGAINALNAAGVNTTAFLASLGIAGITLGFAARDAFSNLISGFLIFIDRPFVIGDLVEIGDNYGRVEQITLRSTRIITVDGKMLAVPNSDIINKTVASYTNFPHLRLNIPVTVGVSENVERVRRILLDIVRNDPNYLSDPAPRVVVTQLNDYNVEVELQAWIKDERAHIPLRFALREAVFDQLNAAGVEMPFETLQVAPLRVRLLDQG
ncbi:MAG: mechanosensitive ion channel family protein [Ardenticatenaceae bacterium]|nr:mechanosensitive ion channel family protein [Ardenticatenaceae bacterium]MCB8987782.1 mechanosensitive ion channel family protein [Ardenticatenaceae bacterium]